MKEKRLLNKSTSYILLPILFYNAAAKCLGDAYLLNFMIILWVKHTHAMTSFTQIRPLFSFPIIQHFWLLHILVKKQRNAACERS